MTPDGPDVPALVHSEGERFFTRRSRRASRSLPSAARRARRDPSCRDRRRPLPRHTTTTTTRAIRARLRRPHRRGTFENDRAAITDKNAPYYVPEARAYVSAPLRQSSNPREPPTRTTRSRPSMPASSCCTSVARTSDAGCRGARRRNGSSARATTRSSTASASTAKGPRRGAWTTSRPSSRTAGS